jgi:hypothetical protein
MAGDLAAFGERLARLETMQEVLARNIEADRETAKAERVEMLRRQEETAQLVRSLTAEIQSYKDQATDALKAGAAFKALAVLGWSALVAMITFTALYGHKVLAAISAGPLPR